MVSNAIIEDYKKMTDKNLEDVLTVSKASGLIGHEYSMCSAPKPDVTGHYSKLLGQTTLSIKKLANAFHKNTAYLEMKDIEHIKDSLSNYLSTDDRVKAFKKELIDDLDGFQKQIRANHIQKMADLSGKKQACEKQIMLLENEKKQLKAGFLQSLWGNDVKAKEYDSKILALKSQLQQYSQKVMAVQQMHPVASEKDILIYQMRLKEKYAKIVEKNADVGLSSAA